MLGRKCWSLSLALVCSAASARAQDLRLPDPLLLPSNVRLTTAAEWSLTQRGRLLDLFREQVYGKPTVLRPSNMSFNVVAEDKNAMGGQATLRRVEIRIQNDAKTSSFTVRLVSFTPNASPQKPVRAFVYINPFMESDTDATRATKSDHWPAEAIVSRGFGTVALFAQDLDPDDPSFDNGVHKFYDNGVRGPSTWGALAAWAWGASRAFDYIETDPRIDPRAVAVIGWSRGGKAALVAGATDTRFALTISNESGEGGAALARRNHGEGIVDLNTKFPHWFALNYRQYNGAPETMPVDQHELIALIAPRAVYASSATLDDWSDPEGEFLAMVNAAPVYQLFGIPGLGTTTFPAAGEHIHKKQMGYHLRVGKHDLTRFDWDLFMDFFNTVDALPEPAAVPDAGAARDADVAASDDAASAAGSREGGSRDAANAAILDASIPVTQAGDASASSDASSGAQGGGGAVSSGSDASRPLPGLSDHDGGGGASGANATPTSGNADANAAPATAGGCSCSAARSPRTGGAASSWLCMAALAALAQRARRGRRSS